MALHSPAVSQRQAHPKHQPQHLAVNGDIANELCGGERRSTAGAVRRNRQQLADAVADSLAEAERRSWEKKQEFADLEAATKESALEEARRRQVLLVALDDNLFEAVPLWHPLLGVPELRAKILARARWLRALDLLKVCKACCCASGTHAWDVYFLMDEID